ncbi:subtilisin-like protein [Lactarius indigo]|nr:subtilisin-like protein [Lactarius indigo]
MRYHRIFVLSALAAIPLTGLAIPHSPRWDELRSKHSRDAVPDGWVCLGPPPNDTTIDLYVVLKSHRENALIDTLYEVSTPSHQKYGAHLSKEQVAKLVAPHPRTLELVHSWLTYHGIPPSSFSMVHSGNTLKLTRVSVSRANDLLRASYQLYGHVKKNMTLVRTIGYALPAALHEHVQIVAPTTSFDSPGTRWQMPRKRFGGAAAGLAAEAATGPGTMPSSRDINIGTVPSVLRSLYSTSEYVPVATDRNMLGIVGYLGQYPSPTDLTLFMNKYRTDGADATFTVEEVNNGGDDPNNPHAESNLNIQYSQGIAYPIKQIFYSTGPKPSGTDDLFLSWLEYVLDLEDIPQTISISYGYNENDYARDQAKVVCGVFGQLGARGVSVLFASGDDGIGEGNCEDSSGNIRFIPIFPATCPEVTAIGGTMGPAPEEAAFFSGGGFSDYFERPPYQDQAVTTFLEDLGDKYQGMYNASGRGVPDIAAQAVDFRLIVKGIDMVADGTSGSAPIVAGIISLLNDYRLSQGQHVLGFLNPWLYGNGLAGLNDVTSGSNPGCDLDGFSAIVGWDPVTGLGTPDFTRLRLNPPPDQPPPDQAFP